MDKMQCILREGTGNPEMYLTLRSAEVYSPRILCAFLVYDKIVNTCIVFYCLQSDFYMHYFIMISN